MCACVSVGVAGWRCPALLLWLLAFAKKGRKSCLANPNDAIVAACCQDADHSFNGIIILKVLPKLLVAFLMKTGLYRLFSCFKYTSVTLQQTLDGLTDNQDLKTVLSYICGDYGVYSYKILELATSSVYGFIEQQKMEDGSLLLIQNLSLKPSLTKHVQEIAPTR